MGGNLTFNNDDGDSTKIQGNSDGTLIGNVADRLKVDATLTGVTIALPASYSSKLRVETVTTPVVLTTGSYTNYYTYSGSGYFIGFSSEFNNAGIIPRVQIDGETIVSGTSITTFGSFQATSNSTDRRQLGSGIIINGANFDWSFRNPIKFNSSVTLSADAGGGVIFTRQLTQCLIFIVKDT